MRQEDKYFKFWCLCFSELLKLCFETKSLFVFVLFDTNQDFLGLSQDEISLFTSSLVND